MAPPLPRRSITGSIPRINPRHRLAQGLAFCWRAGIGGNIDLVNSTIGTTTGTSHELWRYGPQTRLNGTDGPRFAQGRPVITTSSPSDGFGDFTIAVVSNTAASASATRLFMQSNNNLSYNTPEVGLAANSDNGTAVSGCFAFSVYDGVTQKGVASTSTSLIDGDFHLYSGKRTAGTLSIQFDGVDTPGAGAPDINGSGIDVRNNYIGIGTYGVTGESPSADTAAYIAADAWNRALSSDELLELYNDINCFLIFPEEEQERQVYGGAQTIVAAATLAGTGALTARAASLGTLAGTGTLAATGGATATAAATAAGTGALAAQSAEVATLTGTGTLAATGSATATAAATAAGTGALAAVGQATATASASAAGTGTLTARAASNVTLAGIGTLAATGSATATAAATAAGAGALTAQAASTATMAGTGALSAQSAEVATLAGTGTLSAVGRATTTAAATMAGTGALSAFTGTMAVLAGTGALAAVGQATATAAATEAGTGALAAVGRATTTAAATMAGAGALAAVNGSTTIAAATMAGIGALNAAGAATATGIASLPGIGDLFGGGRSTNLLTATMAGTGALNAAGATSGNFPVPATLHGVGTLTAVGIALVAGQAVMAGKGNLAGASVPTLGAIYNGENLSLLVDTEKGDFGFWVYKSSTPIVTVIQPGYIDDAAKRGMNVRDLVWIVDTSTSQNRLCSVLSISNGAADLGDGLVLPELNT